VYDLPLRIMALQDLTTHLAEHGCIVEIGVTVRESIDIHALFAAIGYAGRMMTEWACFIGGCGIPLCLSFSDRDRKGDARAPRRNQTTTHLPFDLEAPFATSPGRASSGCSILSSVSSRDGIICHLPGRYSDASVRAPPRASETGVRAQHSILARATHLLTFMSLPVSIVRRATAPVLLGTISLPVRICMESESHGEELRRVIQGDRLSPEQRNASVHPRLNQWPFCRLKRSPIARAMLRLRFSPP